MAKANRRSITHPKLADVICDLEVVKSFRRVKGDGTTNGFLDGKPAMVRPMLEQLVIADIVNTGDLSGRGEDGEFFMLVTLSQRAFAWLIAAGEETADLEPHDNEDMGEEEMDKGQYYGPGDPEDAEDDDPAEASAGNPVTAAFPSHPAGQEARA